MKHRSLILILMLLAATRLSLGMGWNKVYKDLSSDPRYAKMIGKEYKTKLEFLLFKFADNKKTIILKQVGSSSEVPPAKDMKKAFPFKYYGNTMLGLLPAGSVFKIVRVSLEGAPNNYGVIYRVVITKSSDPKFIGWEIEPTDIADYVLPPDVPQFQIKYVEEITQTLH